jgi:hypothetical protein
MALLRASLRRSLPLKGEVLEVPGIVRDKLKPSTMVSRELLLQNKLRNCTKV